MIGRATTPENVPTDFQIRPPTIQRPHAPLCQPRDSLGAWIPREVSIRRFAQYISCIKHNISFYSLHKEIKKYLDHYFNVLPPVLLTPHIRVGLSQILKSLTKCILKNINTYHTEYTFHETTFRNEYNNIDLTL